MITTIYRRDGSVLFQLETTTTTGETDAEVRLNLIGANLRGADLSGADLRDADLIGADLIGADLSYANLRNANLSGADLRNADLSGANLRNANLRYADLRNADLGNADLRGAVGLTGFFFQVGPIDSWWVSATIEPDGWIFRAGCHRFTAAEAREWWRPENLPAWTNGSAPEHGARMLASVDALIALAKAHNWPEKLEEENPE